MTESRVSGSGAVSGRERLREYSGAGAESGEREVKKRKTV